MTSKAFDNATDANRQQGGRRNLIINGAMQVAQRGTSGTTSGYDSVDRFKVNYTGGTVTQSQESLSSGTPFELGFRKFYRATNTSVATDTAAHFRVIRTLLEGQDVATSGWNYSSANASITLSFWVRSSVSQEFYTQVQNGNPLTRNYAFSIGTLAANTWTKVTKTIVGDSNLAFANDNNLGLEISIVPFWGTNFTTSGSTTDAWYAWDGASRVPDMTSTWATTSGATFDITGVQLEVGPLATPFEHRSYGEELALCQRYYWKYPDANANGVRMLGAGFCYNTTDIRCCVTHPVPMRDEPSYITTNSGSGWKFERTGSGTGVLSNLNTTYRSTQFGLIYSQGASPTGTSGHGTFIYVDASTNSKFEADAEL